MKFDQHDPTHRAAFAVLVAALITFVVWGVWMSLGFVIGAVGWLASKIGAGLLAASTKMTAVHVTVAWIALSCGVIIGTIIGFSLRIDRLWDRFAKRKRSVEERPTAP
jgi:hypothetical protein